MTSCGGTFSVTVRRSTRTIWSTNGMQEDRALRGVEQAAEAEDRRALVLARDLDREEEEQDQDRDDDGEGDQGDTHAVCSSFGRDAPWILRADASPPRCPPRGRASPARSCEPSAVRARQSSPFDEDHAVTPHDTFVADDVRRADRRAAAAHAGRPSRSRTRGRVSVPAIAIATGIDTWYASPAGSKRMSAPRTNMTAPATVKAPWVGDEGLATMKKAASSIEDSPASETGSTCRPYSPRIARSRRRSREDETRVPELDDDPDEADRQHSAMRFGSTRKSRARCQNVDLDVVDLRAGRLEDEPLGHGLHPVDLFSSAGSVGAMTSTRPSCERLARTVVRGVGDHLARGRTLRSCSRASSPTYAAASFTIFRRRSFEMSSPLSEIGVDEPMFVCGRHGRDVRAIVMTAPAESAARSRAARRRRPPGRWRRGSA